MVTQETTQSELAFSLEKPDWVALKILTEEIQDELAQNRHHLLYSLSNWFLAVAIFKRFEDRQMILGQPTERDRDYHRVSLTSLLANGEKLLHELARHHELDTKHIGIQMADVEASVGELRLAHAEWFGDMTPQRKAEILGNLFGVAQ